MRPTASSPISAICSHAGCPVTGWVVGEAGKQVFKCFCHNSEYDPRQNANVVFGPAPRRLAALPVKLDGGALVVAEKFIGEWWRATRTRLMPRKSAASAQPGIHKPSTRQKGESQMTTKRWLWSGRRLGGRVAAGAASPARSRTTAPVDQQRLTNPEPGNWMLYRRTYDGQGYSPLDKINSSNVKNLVPVWTFSTGVERGPRGAAHRQQRRDVHRDAAGAGDRARTPRAARRSGATSGNCPRICSSSIRPAAASVCGRTRSILASTDDHLIALDAKTGKVLWDTKVQDYKKGQYMTLMPLVVNGKVMVGGSGGEFGMRGYVVGLRRQRRQGAVAHLHHSRRPASPAATPGRATTGRPAAARPG